MTTSASQPESSTASAGHTAYDTRADQLLGEARARRTRSRRRGLLAIAAGTALVLGGAGTFAYWSTSASIGGAAITTGDLNLQTSASPTWKLQGALGGSQTIASGQLGSVKLVPGDVLTLTDTVTVTLQGNTIQADLSVNTTGLPNTANITTVLTADTTSVGTNVTASATPNTYRVTPKSDGTDIAVPVTLTVTFDSTTSGRTDVNTTIDLSQVNFTLTQATA